MYRTSSIVNSAIPSLKSLDSQNNHSPICQRRKRNELYQFASSSRALHSDSNSINDNLFKIRVIEIDNKGNSENNTIGDALRKVPFHESKYYVPSSYSAGPDPNRASLPISSGYMSTVNVIVIVFFVLLSTGFVIVCS